MEDQEKLKHTMNAVSAKERRAVFKSSIIIVKDYKKQTQKKKKLNVKAIDQINNTLPEDKAISVPLPEPELSTASSESFERISSARISQKSGKLK
jgi:hypothetical protein